MARRVIAILCGVFFIACAIAIVFWQMDTAERRIHEQMHRQSALMARAFDSGLVAALRSGDQLKEQALVRLQNYRDAVTSLPTFKDFDLAVIEGGVVTLRTGIDGSSPANVLTDAMLIEALEDLAPVTRHLQTPEGGGVIAVKAPRKVDNHTAIVVVLTVGQAEIAAARLHAVWSKLLLLVPLMLIVGAGAILIYLRWSTHLSGARRLWRAEAGFVGLFGIVATLTVAIAWHQTHLRADQERFEALAHGFSRNVSDRVQALAHARLNSIVAHFDGARSVAPEQLARFTQEFVRRHPLAFVAVTNRQPSHEFMEGDRFFHIVHAEDPAAAAQHLNEILPELDGQGVPEGALSRVSLAAESDSDVALIIAHRETAGGLHFAVGIDAAQVLASSFADSIPLNPGLVASLHEVLPLGASRHLVSVAAGRAGGSADAAALADVVDCSARSECHVVPLPVGDRVVYATLSGPATGPWAMLASMVPILAFGMPLTLLLVWMSLYLAERRERTERIMRLRTMALQQSESRFRTLLSSLEDIVFIMDADGRFCDVMSPAGGPDELFAPAAFQGRTPEQIPLPSATREALSRSIARVRHSGKGANVDFAVETGDRARWFGARISPLRDDQGAISGMIGVAREITEQREARRRLEQREAFLRLLMLLSAKFVNSRAETWDDTVDDALARIGAFCEAHRSYLLLFNHDAGTFSNTHEWAAEGTEPQISYLQDLPLHPLESALRHLRNHETVIINDVAALPDHWFNERELLLAQGCVSVILVPVIENDDLMGLVGFDSVGVAREWGDLEAHLLRVFADILASAMARRGADNALRISEERHRELVNRVREVIFRMDPDARLSFLNDAFECMFGVPSHQAIGLPLEHFAIEEDRDGLQKRIARLYAGGVGELRSEIRCRHKSGEEKRIEIFCEAELDEQGRFLGIFGTMLDISERHAALAEVERLAFHDALTNLPNRSLLMQRLAEIALDACETGLHGAVLFIDLDNFKTLNDTYGHDRGDELLIQVARRLAASVRSGDVVARLGGDEFVVVLSGLDPDATVAEVRARIIAESLRATLNEGFELSSRSHHVSPSIGVTVFSGREHNVETLLRHADLAMYRAKAAGRDNISFFTPDMERDVMRRAGLEADLRLAIDEREFHLHFQPQVDEIGLITGAEALIRWQHPTRGHVSPGDFIPVAEKTGLIVPIGRQVADMACAHLARIHRITGRETFTMAINISARQFREPDFVADLQAAVGRHEIPASCLKLELTESLFLDDLDFAVERMQRLKEAGFRFALDDFGTGYSSLTYLKKLPFDEIKVDQAFVADILESERAATIVETIIRMGKALDLRVIAEGVETAGQLTRLLEGGCEAYQGYFFGRPAPIEEFLETLRERDAFLETTKVG
jgi:diguanylate cyclase (GGDEF)-like protein/PAS domain S-box-containing protein